MRPEHGIRGVANAGAGDRIEGGFRDGGQGLLALRQLPVPTAEMLEERRRALYDIQDVGARVYTYRVDDGAHRAGPRRSRSSFSTGPIPSVRTVGGKHARSEVRSLVGQYPVALRYGLTPGELLRFLAGTK